MAKQLNVNLAVTANTQQAKAALVELNKSLSDVLQTKSITIKDESINNAKQAAMDLKRHLDAAVNVNTGKLDLSKFSASLTKSGQSLQQLHQNLSKIGPEGQSAFLALSKSIASADASALTLGNKLGGLLTTLKNTARWQISSSILHGFMGTIQSAYGYAQDLNESLNNIRIVTGQNVDQMAAFAKQANEAARALSTTTTRYTDAALIYYQQGLSGKEVTDRVNTTIKLANVSRQSAEEVSSQMTAIWNNFADGSKSLEYYADVITKLGAATAASSSEISDGLQKFASVADTVGLSYEKATAALATVVAETRQSADVVGTAFKTMFARFQGLQLGETLEDGVTLNKYAQALSVIGVNILDANGNLRVMDDILDDTAEKWNTISEAQKVALAETVAGTRQYAQFMAIMNNYDKILANQKIGANSEGTLQQQADIYGESWEAASKRVRAALEEVYTQLLNDKFFITLLNGAEKTVDIISNVIDGLGGIKGMLLLIGSIVLNKYAKEMPAFFEKVIQNISILTGKAEQNRQSMLSQNLQIVNSMKGGTSSQEVSAQIDTMSKVSDMTLKLAQNRQRLSQAEIENYENKIKEVQIYGEVAAAIGKEVDQIKKETEAKRSEVRNSLQDVGNYSKINLNKFGSEDQQVIASAQKMAAANNQNYKKLSQAKEEAKEALAYAKQLGGHAGIQKAQKELDAIDLQLKQIVQNITGRDLLQGLEQSAEQLGKAENILSQIGDKTKIWADQAKQLGAGSVEIEDMIQDMEKYINIAEQAGLDTKDLKGALDDFRQGKISIEDVVNSFKDFESTDLSALRDKVEQFQTAITALGGNTQALEVYIAKIKEGASAEQALAAAKDFLNQKTDESITKTLQFSEAMGRLAGAATQVVMIINAFKNIGNIINNDDLTDGEKFLQIATSATMILPNLINLLNAEKLANLSSAAARVLGIAGIESETKAHWLSVPAKTAAGTAGWVALGPLLLFVGIIGVVVGGIIAIAKAIETDTEKLKRLKKEQEELNAVVEEANKEWEEFKNNLSGYDEAAKGLSKLTQGTEEFNEKLREANNLAKDLITKLSLDFLEDYFYNDQGLITFTSQGQQKINKANKQIQSGQKALSWAQYEKDREVKAQEQKITDKDRLAEINERNGQEFKERFDVSAASLESLQESLLRSWVVAGKDVVDKNGLIDTDKINLDDVATFLQEQYYGDKSRDYDAMAKYLLGSYEEQGRVKQFQSANYSQEKNDITEFLGAENPYANIIANSLFDTQEEIEQRMEEARAKITPKTVDQLWEDTYGMLTDDQQKELLEKYNKDKAAALLPGVLAGVYEELATGMSDSIKENTDKFSDQNSDILTKLLTKQTQNLSPEQMQKSLTLSDNEAEGFINAYNALYGTELKDVQDILALYKEAQSSYSVADWHKSQIQGIEIAQEKVAALNKALGSLSLGDTIDPDVYKNLSQDMQSYFVMMEDGTFKLIGDAEQFQAALFREKVSGFDNDLQQYQELANTQVSDTRMRYGDEEVYQRDRGLTEEELQAVQNTAIAYAMASDSLDQLNQVKKRFIELSVPEEVQTIAIDSALQDLASKYDTCTDELKDFQTALRLGDKTLIASTKDALKYSIQTAELAKKMDLSVDDIEDQAKAFQKENKELQNNVKNIKNQQKVATQMAVLNQSMNKGVTTLAANWEDWNKILQAGDKTSMDYIDTVQQMRTALADLLGITDEDLIPKDFFDVPDNLDNMELAAQGDVQAINLLGTAFAQSFIESQTYVDGMNTSLTSMFDPANMVSMDEFLTGLTDGLADSETAFNYYRDNVLEGITNLQDAIKNGTLEAGQDITSLMDGTGASWVDSLNAMAIATGMSVDEMRSLLNSLGVEAEIGVKEETVHQKVPRYVTKTEVRNPGNLITGDGREVVTSTWQDGYDEFDGVMEVAQINMGAENAGKQPKTVRYAGRSTPSTSALSGGSSGKGGGGGKDPTYSKASKKDEENRYADIENHLKTLTDQYNRMREARDHAYGTAKFDKMKEEMKFLKEMQKAQSAYLDAIFGEDSWQDVYDKIQNGGLISPEDITGGYLKKDLDDFYNDQITYRVSDTAGNSWDVNQQINLADILPKFELDLNRGFAGNEEEFKEALEDWYNRQVEEYNKKLEANPDNVELKNKLSWIEAVYNTFLQNFGKLEGTLDLAYDKIDEYKDYEYQIQDIEDALPRQQLEIIEDEEHRYDELNKTLEGLVNQYDRLGKARERAWGTNKIKLLEKEAQKLEQLQKTYERYLKTIAGDNWQQLHNALQSGGDLGKIISSGRAGGNLQKDFDKIVKPLTKAIEYIYTDEKNHQQKVQRDWNGLREELKIDVILNEFGQISNSDDIAEALEQWDRDFYSQFGANEEEIENGIARASAELQGKIAEHEALKDFIEKILSQYADSISTLVENSDALQDNLYEQQAKFYETFRYKLDLKIEISERSLKRIEYAIKVLGDNIYKIPEIMQSWYNKRVGETMGEVTGQASTWASAFTEAQAAHAEGKMTDEDYIQTIKDAQDGLYGCIDALLEINEEMREYYKNVLSRVKDEMSRITSEMDHQLDTVNHLQNVLSLLGRDTDYAAIGKILDAQLQMNENGYNVSKAQVEMYRHQVELAEQHLQDLIAQGVSEEAQNEWKNAVLYPAKEALLEAEKEMQADFEAYLETINAIYENKINQIYQDSERRLAGAWGSFDQLNNAMERQRALDEEYLTKTNQIYETNVLIRKLAQDIDKTNNESSKLKLKNFSAEIEGLQQKNKLSKSELDIAKARYEVLLAEIALEDARNAKSTVRLQRDNEGNYGYVYTADADNIAAAEDDLAKKNNDLYNLVLSQANNYTEKIIQLTQERNAALKDLDMAWAEGRITDEDAYNKAREDIINKYNSLIEEDYESYYRALYWLDETAATDHTEAWGTSFQDVLDAEEDFKGETDTIIGQTGEAINWLNDLRAKATDEAKVGNGDLEKQLENLTKANDALAKEMLEDVIPRSDEVLELAQKLTAEWVSQYDEIMRLINAYLELIDAMQAVLKEMANFEEEEEELEEDNFDINKDYSQSAAKKYAENGKVTEEVIQELLYRRRKEDELGGHNEKWATNEQLLEFFDKLQTESDERLTQFLDDVLNNGAYFYADTLKELGITGEDYDLEAFQASLDANTEVQAEGNDLQRQAQEQAAELDDAAEERSDNETDAQTDNAETNEETATNLQDFITSTLEQVGQDAEDFKTQTMEELHEMVDEIRDIKDQLVEDLTTISDNLGGALESNATTVSTAVESAAITIAGAIIEAANAARDAEDAAARAESAAAEAVSAAASVPIETPSSSSSGGGGGGHLVQMAFASGGYTGSWGSSGKLAVLHEKELVLNADDTVNLLSAVSLLRDFASAIDLRAAASNISTGLSSPAYEAGSQTLEQSVTIHAEFPNATNHSEIEEAFSNLVNRASQYANRS